MYGLGPFTCTLSNFESKILFLSTFAVVQMDDAFAIASAQCEQTFSINSIILGHLPIHVASLIMCCCQFVAQTADMSASKLYTAN